MDILDKYEYVIGALYDPVTLERAIESISTGDNKEIQKLIVLYEDTGIRKSTLLNIYQEMFKDINSEADKWSDWRRICNGCFS